MREYFCAYHDMLGAMRKLSDAECGRLFRALLAYSSGEQLDNLQGREELLFDVFAQQIDRDAARYEKKCSTNRENVNSRKRTITTVNERKRPLTNVNDRYQEKEKEKEKDEVPPTPCGGLWDDDDELLKNAAMLDEVFDAAAGIGLTGAKSLEKANRLAADYSPAWVLEAISRASNAPKDAWCWRYIEGILRRWKTSGGMDDEKPAPKQAETSHLIPWLERGTDD